MTQLRESYTAGSFRPGSSICRGQAIIDMHPHLAFWEITSAAHQVQDQAVAEIESQIKPRRRFTIEAAQIDKRRGRVAALDFTAITPP